MRGTYRGIFSALVDDPDFQRLSPPARHVFLTLRVCPQVGPAGIFRFYPAVLAEQTGLDVEAIEKALVELTAGFWVIREGPILWLRNALRHDPSMRASDPKHLKSIERWLSGLPKLEIILSFCDYYKITRPFGDPAEAHRGGIRQEKEKESEKDQEERIGVGDRGGQGAPAGLRSATPRRPFPDTLEAWEQQQQATAHR